MWVFRVDKNTGEETARLKIRLIGDFSDCRALDKRHILLWTTANEKYDELFAKYQEKTGNSRIAYLHDLDTAEKYLVKDRILCRLGGEDIVLYSQEGENRALLLNLTETRRIRRNAIKTPAGSASRFAIIFGMEEFRRSWRNWQMERKL